MRNKPDIAYSRICQRSLKVVLVFALVTSTASKVRLCPGGIGRIDRIICDN